MTITIHILHYFTEEKMMAQEAEWVAQGHMASSWQNLN